MMSFTLPPLSRRQFLGQAAALAAGLWTWPHLRAAEGKVDADRVALLSDTHIDAKADTVDRDANMAANLRAVVAEIAALPTLPGTAIVNGDLAHHDGQAAEYAAFLELVAPLRAAGLPLHLGLGNHDHHERFWAAVPPAAAPPVEHRQVAVIATPRANFFLLDSLLETNQPPGKLGDVQLKWLATALDAHADRPALAMVHHDPGSLNDQAALLAVLKPRQQVKALIFGHTHNWKLSVVDGLYLINLPPTAYVFSKGRPSGWVDLQLAAAGATIELHALDHAHPEHGKPQQLAWR